MTAATMQCAHPHQHPVNFRIDRKPGRRGQAPIGTTDVMGPDERAVLERPTSVGTPSRGAARERQEQEQREQAHQIASAATQQTATTNVSGSFSSRRAVQQPVTGEEELPRE